MLIDWEWDSGIDRIIPINESGCTGLAVAI
jgi:hypothetical protein